MLKRVPPKNDDLSVVIQAGGESRRMGQPKAFVSFLDHPMIWHPVQRLYPIATELIITTNDSERMKKVFEHTEFSDIRFEHDLRDERGALSGLYTALSVARYPFVALSACDMIFANRKLFMYLYKIIKQSDYDVVVPHVSSGFEPFHAVYRRESCLALVKEALFRGEKKLSSWFSEAKLFTVSSEDTSEINPQKGAFQNINTPDDLQRIEERVKQGDFAHLQGWEEE